MFAGQKAMIAQGTEQFVVDEEDVTVADVLNPVHLRDIFMVKPVRLASPVCSLALQDNATHTNARAVHMACG
jgi:hypothetical protein